MYYSEAHILELAKMIAGGSNTKVTPHGMKYITQLKHDIFSMEFNHKFHRCFEKSHDVILKLKRLSE